MGGFKGYLEGMFGNPSLAKIQGTTKEKQRKNKRTYSKNQEKPIHRYFSLGFPFFEPRLFFHFCQSPAVQLDALNPGPSFLSTPEPYVYLCKEDKKEQKQPKNNQTRLRSIIRPCIRNSEQKIKTLNFNHFSLC